MFPLSSFYMTWGYKCESGVFCISIPRCLITWDWGRRRQWVKDECHLTESETGSYWTFCREIKEPNKNPMSPSLGLYFSNLIFFRLLLSVPSKVIPLYLVFPTRRLTLHLMYKILLFFLLYRAVPALSPSLAFYSKAQALQTTYPKFMPPY